MYLLVCLMFFLHFFYNKTAQLLILCTLKALYCFFLQMLQIENIYHAFHCNKLQKKGCPEAFCTSPQRIINVVNHNLSQVYEKGIEGNIRRESIARTYKLVISHAIHCRNQSACSMPLCKEYK